MFATKAWACSFKDINWRAEGFEGAKLEYLAMKSGFFFEGHRATVDCLAGLELLSRKLPVSGETALSAMLGNARQATHRIWAEHAPFEFKDHLKRKGYVWNDGNDGRPKAWFFDVQEEERADEVNWLKAEICQREDIEPTVTRFTSFDRYSARI